LVKVVDEELQRYSVSVDIIGINEDHYGDWSTKRLSDYWSPNDPLRERARQAGMLRSMKFGPGLGTSDTLSATDPLWGVWKQQKARYVFVMADIPGVPNDSDKRLSLTLKDVSGKGITVEVLKSGLNHIIASKK
jgi:hypothetical protein